MGHSGLLLVVPEVAGDIFSAAAYLAIWPLSSDLQSDLNSHQQKMLIEGFSAFFKKFRLSFFRSHPMHTARPFTVTRLIGVSDLDKYPEAGKCQTANEARNRKRGEGGDHR